MDFNETVQNSMSGFEELVKKIPGYKGYKEKEQRREADAMLREHLARQCEGYWATMNDLKSQMLLGPAMSQLDEMGRCSRKLQTLIDKIKGAAQGYSGFFDAVKVKEEQLDALYDFDNDMLQQVEAMDAEISGVQAALDAGDGIPQAVRSLEKTIGGLLTAFDARDEAVLNAVSAASGDDTELADEF